MGPPGPGRHNNLSNSALAGLIILSYNSTGMCGHKKEGSGFLVWASREWEGVHLYCLLFVNIMKCIIKEGGGGI